MDIYTVNVLENRDPRGRWVKVNAATMQEAVEKAADECLLHGYSPDYGRVAKGDYVAFICVETFDFVGNRITAGVYQMTVLEGGK